MRQNIAYVAVFCELHFQQINNLYVAVSFFLHAIVSKFELEMVDGTRRKKAVSRPW